MVEHLVTDSPCVPQGHKRAPSDASVASSEDEKICLSPTLLESVPEKTETILPAATPTELPGADSVEEPPAPPDGGPLKQTTNAPLDNGDVYQKAVEEKLLPAGEDAASLETETEAEPTAPVSQMHHLEITAADTKEVEAEEKEVDTGEILPTEQASSPMSEVSEEKMEESESPTEEEEQYQHLKVTLTLPEQNKIVPKEENKEKPTGKDNVNTSDEQVPDKAKDSRMRDSGGVSASDNRNMDLNLSISSFLSKAKEPASVSVQVTPLHSSLFIIIIVIIYAEIKSSLFFTSCHQAPEEDIEKDSQIHSRWSGS